MKKINLVIIICLILFCSCQNNGEEELKVFPVERINSSNPAPIPVMNGTIPFIPGKNTPQDATYRMYFDTSENPTTVFDLKIPEKKYTNLKINTAYYWRVETISNKGEVLASSPVWKFITGITITVRTQSDLTLLGSNKYSKIEGILIIGDLINLNGSAPPSTDISDLSPLKELNQVYKLVINNNNLLKNLNGLSNLKIINDDLFIGQGQDLKGGNSSLEDISALSNIESLGGTLIIYNNDNLTSLTGLESLKSISQDLVIDNNMKLDNFCALELLFNNSGLSGNYYVKDNSFNPTKTNLIDGNCN
ncbi:hypothetical protein [uncultured Tenacibaculum sp.]|uniref:hypothetical protein n=1 Tax=uncultured Tenacibaculum sp. TaxID=174713 RepID=UPI002613DBF5|nr:hypothetical protein [uncultured Tenacibaculum sp.]